MPKAAAGWQRSCSRRGLPTPCPPAGWITASSPIRISTASARWKWRSPPRSAKSTPAPAKTQALPSAAFLLACTFPVPPGKGGRKCGRAACSKRSPPCLRMKGEYPFNCLTAPPTKGMNGATPPPSAPILPRSPASACPPCASSSRVRTNTAAAEKIFPPIPGFFPPCAKKGTPPPWKYRGNRRSRPPRRSFCSAVRRRSPPPSSRAILPVPTATLPSAACA